MPTRLSGSSGETGGARGFTVIRIDACPGLEANAPWGRATLTCTSFVVRTSAWDPPWPDRSSENVPPDGFMLLFAALGGGFTQLYWGGGANPSNRGRRARGCHAPPPTASTTYTD